MTAPSELSFPGTECPRTEPAAAGIDPDRLDSVAEYARAHESTVPRDFSNHEERFGETVSPLPDDRGEEDRPGALCHRVATAVDRRPN